MKILGVNKYYYIKGGCEAYYFSLKKGLEERGFEFIPFSMKSESNVKSAYSHHFVDEIDYYTRSFLRKIKYALKVIYSFEARRRIERLTRLIKPDIAHLHNFSHQLSPSILSPLKKQKIPVVYTAHDLKLLCPNYKMRVDNSNCEKCIDHRYYHCLKACCVKSSRLGSLVNAIEMYLHRWLKSYEKIDMIIAPSRFYRDKFIEFGYSPQKVRVIPNFIEAGDYEPCYQGHDYILYFGRLSEEKGLLTLLEAIKSVKDCPLYIAGTGPMKALIEELIQLGRLNARLLGHKSGAELKELIKKSRFTVLPSEWYENCPMSVLESFACGKPVIGSDIGGIPELVVHGKNGLLFESGNAVDLSKKIRALLKSPDKCAEYGRNGREMVERRHDRRTHLEQITRLYEELLENKKRSNK